MELSSIPSARILRSIPLALLLLTSWAAGASGGMTRPPFGEAEAGELAHDLAELVERYRIPGAAVALVSADSILWSGGFGTVDGTAEPVTPTTRFRVGSISKSLTALAVLRLAEAGRLDLDTPVGEVLPEVDIPNPWARTDPVRLVHLLEHTAGIEDQHFHDVYNLVDDPGIPLQEVVGKNPRARRVRWRPGTRTAYSNLGYTLAGCVLERVTGLPFEDLLEDSVLAPLGMDRSTFRVTPAIASDLVPGHTGPGGPAPFRHLYQRPASALVSTADDLSRLVQLLLNRGRRGDTAFLSPGSVGRMEAGRSSTAARAGYGLAYGLGNRAGLRHGLVYHGHGGGLPEYSSIYAYVPETGRGCVVLTNTGAEGLNALFGRVFRLVAAGGTPQTAVTLDRLRLAELTGTYQYANPERRLDAVLNLLLAGTTISLEGDTLYRSELGGDPVALSPVSPTAFRPADGMVATLVFATDADGRAVLCEPLSRAEYVRVPAWRPFVHRAFILAVVGLMLSTLVYALLWIPAGVLRRLRRRRAPGGPVRLKLLPLLAVLSLLAALAMLSLWSAQPQLAGRATPPAVAFAVLTVAFALLSAASLGVGLATLRSPRRRRAAIFPVLVSAVFVGFAVYLWYWDIIGLRLWAY